MTTATQKTQNAKARRKQVVDTLKDLPLIGEVVTWDSIRTTRDAVLQSLKDNGLDEGVARELTPRAAFTRACDQMAEDQLVDLVKDHGDQLVYQVTAKALKQVTGSDDDEYEYQKQAYVRLHKDTGVVTSKSPKAQEWFQREMAEAMNRRTANDVSSLIQRLFAAADVDLLPWRRSGSVYLVFDNYSHFVDKIEAFLEQLGGQVNRLPVPKGVQKAEKAVASTVSDAMSQLIEDHQKAIEALDITSRKDTLEKAAQRIKETKLKIEAYAQYLKGKGEGLESSLEACQQRLACRVQEISNERKSLPPEKKTTQERVAEVLTNEPMTMKQIMTAAGIDDTCYNALQKLINEGVAVKDGSGYRLA